MASIVHLTGDAGLLDGPIRLQPAAMGVLDGGLSPDEEGGGAGAGTGRAARVSRSRLHAAPAAVARDDPRA